MIEKSSQLLKQIKQLEIIARKNVASLNSGNFRTGFKGSGMLFKEARRYVSGESIRQIDWNITARMNQAFVKVVEEEREREIVVLLDISPSMRSGFQERSKLEYAAELTSSLCLSALHAQDKFSLITYSDKIHSVLRSSRKSSQLHFAIRDIVSALNSNESAEISDCRIAIKELEKKRGKKFIVFIVSDFIDHDVPEDIKFLRSRHDVTLMHVFDHFEFNNGLNLKSIATSAEAKKKSFVLNSNSLPSLGTFKEAMMMKARSLKIDYIEVDTSIAPNIALQKYFGLKSSRIN